ncbi:DNA internalization-related competence protein ComEC/Rec2 [Fructilactobacillus sp. Tb1]|uniref:DNA internalization-related competence protein ComEC/Rec2 n=1 Tax=Fructilactobacillus sp. Tb1 TaxID=3422304 RepID=UPI003D2C65E6
MLIGSICVLLVLMRIWRLKLNGFLLKNICLAIIPLVIFTFHYQQKHIKQQTITKQSQTNQTLEVEVLPDEIHINENRYRAIVYFPSAKQSVLLFGTMKNDRDEKIIKSIKQKTRLTLSGSLSELESAPNVNQFDSKQFYGQQGIYGQIRVTTLQQTKPSSLTLMDRIHLIRFWGLEKADQLPKHLKMYVQSLIFGYKNVDFKEEMDGVQQLGLIHLFSISGMHVYFLMDVILMLTSLMYLKRERVEWFLIGGLPIYSVIAGSAVGLIRAILMIEERLVAGKCKLYFTRLDVWSLALMLNLLINPMLLLEFGCQLSYALSLALIYTGNVGDIKRTLLLELVSFPIVIFYMYEWHVLSLMANLLIIPFFTVIIFPLVLLGFILGWLKLPGFTIIDRFLMLFDQFTSLIAQLPGKITFGKPWIVFVILMILLGLLYMERAKLKYIILLLFLSLGMYLIIHFPLNGEVTFFDVGQGDSFLIRSPFNKSVTLIDTGGKPNFFAKEGQKDVYLAPNTSIRYLKSIGINHIDNICLSHQDADHVGDLPAFLKEMKVDRIYIPLGMERNQHFMDKLKPFKGFQLISVREGEIISGTNLRVIHPFTAGLGKNEDSMVLYSEINHLKWMFTGDLDRADELKILEKYPDLKTDILKLGHHGSKTSSDPKFIEAIQPKIGIISAGRNNHYGHPNQETIETMKKDQVKLISTQTDGMISYRYQNQTGYFTTKWKGDLNGINR